MEKVVGHLEGGRGTNLMEFRGWYGGFLVAYLMQECSTGLVGFDGYGNTLFFGSRILWQEGWNVDRLRCWLPNQVVSQILLISFDTQVKDKILWASSKIGTFSLSSAWEVIRQRQNSSLVNKVVWNMLIL